ncbi:hypothetical protein NMY22_g12509 [Coprinellus aureogranulatus]|nr:hypothetical protein NMY22_g12509 [Coprinellus aureogranulatus]
MAPTSPALPAFGLLLLDTPSPPSTPVPAPLSRYELRSSKQRGPVSEPPPESRLEDLAVTSLNIEKARYQIGCSVIRALDQVQGLVGLYKRRTNIMTEITSTSAEGFNGPCRLSYDRLYHENARRMGQASTGTPDLGSIVNFSREELISLGVAFSTKPGSLQLDRTMSQFWGHHLAAGVVDSSGEPLTFLTPFSLLRLYLT